MIFLDTNVVTEPMKANGDPAVQAWLDQQAAVAYAPLVSHARNDGRTVSVADGQITAVASLNGFTVATRDTEPFEAVGVPVINP